MTASSLAGCAVAFLTASDGVEQSELTEPWAAIEQAGGSPALISEAPGSVQAYRHLTPGDAFPVDRVVSEERSDHYNALVLPGGVANPDFLRTVPNAVRLVGEFVALGRPVAAICHAPWLLIEADVVRGIRVTSYPSLASDLRNAGADWVDEDVVVDRRLITSRRPDDLPVFCATLIEEISRAATQSAVS